MTWREKNGETRAFMSTKIVWTVEYSIIDKGSVASFVANWIQSRIASTEFGTKLATIYEAFDVKREADYNKKMAELSADDSANQETVSLIKQLNEAWALWENFLQGIDKELERIAGPNVTQPTGLDSKDNIHLMSHNKKFKDGTLLSYVKNSTYEMILLEVCGNFSVMENYDHVKKLFEALSEFHRNSCDILLLTKRPNSGGGGFLKLIGMPFRILLNEEQSMKQILAHRQPVSKMAGTKAIHIYAEFVCNVHSLEISRPDEMETDEESMRSVFGSQSGCVIIDRRGRILYSYLCTDVTDWPDVEVLLEQVRINRRPRNNSASKDGDPNQISAPTQKEGVEQVANNTMTTSTTDPSTNVTVHKNKCCTIL
ncbi:hypothetical protein Ddc_02280 [Ditylenchus destructor]|nr:hypothetical protein Ddc_02280 [Ditylenchus destructor]